MTKILLITALLSVFNLLNASAQKKVYSIKSMKCDMNGKAVEIDYKPNAVKISIDEAASEIVLITLESPFEVVLKIGYTTNANKPSEHTKVFLCTSSPAEGSQSVTVFLDKFSRCILFNYREKQFGFIY